MTRATAMNVWDAVDVILLFFSAWSAMAMIVGGLRNIHPALYMLSVIGVCLVVLFTSSLLGQDDIRENAMAVTILLLLAYMVFFGNVIERKKINMKDVMLFKDINTPTRKQ